MRIPIESSLSYRGRNHRPNWFALLGFIVSALCAGAIGAVFSPAASDHVLSLSDARPARPSSTTVWYDALAKPAWTPPAWTFGPVWTVLYVLMGVAAWLVWHERYHRSRNTALLAYALQLGLNAVWAPVFFGTKSIGTGLFLIVSLWVAVAWTLREFSRIKPMAAALLLPYLAWMTVAAALNLRIWRDNP